MKLSNVSLAVILLLIPLLLHAQSSVCSDMIDQAAHNVGITTSSSEYLNSVFDNYCKSDGTTKSSSFNIGLNAVIEGIPLGLTGGSSDASTQISNFCRNYATSTQARSAAFSYNSQVVEKAFQSANDCLLIAETGNFVSYQIVTPTTLAITFNVGTGNTLNIQGVAHDPLVQCIGPAAHSGTTDYGGGTSRSLPANVGSYKIVCTRKPSTVADGKSIYSEAAIIVGTNSGHGLNIYWPQDTVLPMKDADQIQANLQAISAQLQQLGDAQKLGALPKGTILAWDAKNQPVPKGWAPCDGSNPLAPDLRDKFLRGVNSSNVGVTGGSDTHAHAVAHAEPNGLGFNAGGTNYMGRSDPQPNVPQYMGVLYIMKISD